ncbi:MAG: hypothetical protein JG782_1564 [Anaerophaga sp.]|nr:hypothetical protein [Anaerophaga sp.]
MIYYDNFCHARFINELFLDKRNTVNGPLWEDTEQGEA